MTCGTYDVLIIKSLNKPIFCKKRVELSSIEGNDLLQIERKSPNFGRVFNKR